jgi:hypothetical protein
MHKGSATKKTMIEAGKSDLNAAQGLDQRDKRGVGEEVVIATVSLCGGAKSTSPSAI